MSARIDLAGFESRFAADPDPWATFSARDEAVKRGAILRALGAGPRARILELACGNGSNSVRLAERAQWLDACDGAASAVALTTARLADRAHAAARRLVLPGRFPRPRYEAIVIAELLYYLDRSAMARLARDTARALAPGGRLVLAHHHVDFHDTAQTASDIHRRFLVAARGRWQPRYRRRNHRWIVEAVTPSTPPERPR